MLHNPISGVMTLLTTGKLPTWLYSLHMLTCIVLYIDIASNIQLREPSHRSINLPNMKHMWNDGMTSSTMKTSPENERLESQKVTKILERKIIFPTFIFGFHVMLTFCPKNPDPSKMAILRTPKTPLRNHTGSFTLPLEGPTGDS